MYWGYKTRGVLGLLHRVRYSRKFFSGYHIKSDVINLTFGPLGSAAISPDT